MLLVSLAVTGAGVWLNTADVPEIANIREGLLVLNAGIAALSALYAQFVVEHGGRSRSERATARLVLLEFAAAAAGVTATILTTAAELGQEERSVSELKRVLERQEESISELLAHSLQEHEQALANL